MLLLTHGKPGRIVANYSNAPACFKADAAAVAATLASPEIKIVERFSSVKAAIEILEAWALSGPWTRRAVVLPGFSFSASTVQHLSPKKAMPSRPQTRGHPLQVGAEMLLLTHKESQLPCDRSSYKSTIIFRCERRGIRARFSNFDSRYSNRSAGWSRTRSRRSRSGLCE